MEQPQVSFADEARRRAGADKAATAGPSSWAALPEEQHLTPDQPANEKPNEARAPARAAKADAPVAPAQDGGEQKQWRSPRHCTLQEGSDSEASVLHDIRECEAPLLPVH